MNGLACTNSILGNRLTKGSDTYGWDALNRMTSYGTGVNTSAYQYRGDGMRTLKQTLPFPNNQLSKSETTYRYDGQMGMQDVKLDYSRELATDPWMIATTTVTDYALGARGIDAISKSVNGAAATVSFPLYDAHGNTIGTLARSGSSFTTANERYYDAWGAVNFGGTTGDPKGRYCASIGHKQDDESGLVYMRARYYEPSSGRFVSEDPAKQGLNWFPYCGNNPIGRVDQSGSTWTKADFQDLFFILLGCLSSNLFVATFKSLLISGLLAAMSPCSFGLSLIGTIAFGNDVLHSAGESLKDAGKFLPSSRRNEAGIKTYKHGVLVEVVGFLVAWYSLLNFMFRNINELFVDN